MNLCAGDHAAGALPVRGARRRGEYQQQAEATEHHAADTDLQQVTIPKPISQCIPVSPGKTCERTKSTDRRPQPGVPSVRKVLGGTSPSTTFLVCMIGANYRSAKTRAIKIAPYLHPGTQPLPRIFVES